MGKTKHREVKSLAPQHTAGGRKSDVTWSHLRKGTEGRAERPPPLQKPNRQMLTCNIPSYSGSFPEFIGLIYSYLKVMILHLTFPGQGIKQQPALEATVKVANQVSRNLGNSPSSPLNGDLQEANEVPWVLSPSLN